MVAPRAKLGSAGVGAGDSNSPGGVRISPIPVPCFSASHVFPVRPTIHAMPLRAFLQIFKTAARRWLERDAFEHAGALGFATLFSLAPLVIIVVAIVGIVFGEDAAS